MAWLIPSITAALAGTAILAFCYYYLFFTGQQKIFKNMVNQLGFIFFPLCLYVGISSLD